MIPVWWLIVLVVLLAIVSVAQVILHGRHEYRRGWNAGLAAAEAAAMRVIAIWLENERAKIRGEQ